MQRLVLFFSVLALFAFEDRAQADVDDPQTQISVQVKRMHRGWSGSRAFGIPRLGLVEENTSPKVKDVPREESQIRACMTTDGALLVVDPDLDAQVDGSANSISKLDLDCKS